MSCLYFFILSALANLGLAFEVEHTFSPAERQACSCSVSPPPSEAGGGSLSTVDRKIDRPDHIYNGF